jgi:hypothetical protein
VTAELEQGLRARFGAGGLRRYTAAEIADAAPAGPDADLLTGVGLPDEVGVYFAAAESDTPPTLGAFAAANDREVAPEQAGWLRLGTDQGLEICLAADGTVWGVDTYGGLPTRAVNRGLAAFLESLLALDRHLGVLADPGQQDAAAVYRELRAALRAIDAPAVEHDENWWALVLEDIRHSISFPFSAAVKYRNAAGEEQILTAQATPAGPHPEERLYRALQDQDVPGEAVSEVYTELKACVMPGHYCAWWLGTAFPDATFTHSFDYGDTAAERESALIEAIRNAASQQG